MVTSSAVVGSSAMISLGLQASPIAIITRWRMPPDKLMRILLEPALAVGDADQPQQLERARARLRLAHLEVDEQRLHDLLPDRQDRIERGHRLLEDHRDVAAAHLAHLARRRDRAGCGPSNRMRPAVMRPVFLGSSRMMASEDTDLPQPDLPTMATISPRLTV